MTDGPYTTITVQEYNRIKGVIIHLRWRIQKAREMLEANRTKEAATLLAKTEDEAESGE